MNRTLSFNNPFGVLRQDNFRIYWIGFVLSVIGTWMQRIAQPWLAYQITDSPLLLSMIGVAQAAPVFMFSLFSGVIIDHFPRRKLLLLTQALSFGVTLTLAVLIYADYIRYWHILAGAFILGTINSLDMPARQSFYVELVEKESLMNAIGLCSSAFNLARIIGPLIAGYLMIYLRISTCFLINSLSFGAMFICLCLINPVNRKKGNPGPREDVLQRIQAGLLHIRGNRILIFTLSGMFIMGVFGLNFTIMLPVLVKSVLKTDAGAFSLLMSFMGIGSLAGALTVASIGKGGPRPFILSTMPFILGILIFLTGLIHNFSLLSIIMVGSGLSTVLFTSSSNAMTQLNLEEEFRGRVMGIYILISNGATALGSLMAGIIMERFTVNRAYMLCGGSMVALFALLSLLRDIPYTRENTA